MDLNLRGKKVAITGAAGSFGQAFVKELVAHGAIVYAISRTKTKLDALSQAFPTIIPILCDVRKWDETEKILTASIPNDINMLINNSGVAHSETIENLTEAAVDEILQVNLKGTLCVTKLVVNKMKESSTNGSIVNISSVASDFPCDFLLAYAITKAGINRLTKSLATQLGPHNIRVNSINPGLIPDTAMGDAHFDTEEKKNFIKGACPLPIAPTTDDVSKAVLFYLSDQAKSLTGQIVFVDSGMHMG